MLQSSIKKSLILFLLCLNMTNAFVNPSSLFGVSTGTTPRQSHILSSSKHSDRFDMEELRHRIQQEKNHPLFDGLDNMEEQPQTVHILMFNPGTEQQGAHSIEFPKGSGNNSILAFASEEACHKFADSLKEQNFFDPTVSDEIVLQLHHYILFHSSKYLTT
jgi:hypothetical protein